MQQYTFAFCRLFDTGANEDLRKSSYPGSDVVLVCLPAVDIQQNDVRVVKNELKLFIEEAKRFCNCIVIVGTKSDEKGERTDSIRMGWNLVRELGAQIYCEHSSHPSFDSMRLPESSLGLGFSAEEFLRDDFFREIVHRQFEMDLHR